MMSEASLLNDRGVIKVTGPDATTFLHRLLTNSMLDMATGEGRFTGLLSPQGKLLFDFLVTPVSEGAAAGYLIDCVKEQVAELIKRLNFQKLRAKLTIEDLSASLAVAALWGGAPPEQFAEKFGGVAFQDPRDAALGYRLIAAPAALAEIATAAEEAYEAHRIACGTPKGGVDFVYGDSFVHDVNLDYLHGVDFKKGCYVGQEVVARVHFRNSARKRIVKIHFDGPTPAAGTEVKAGETSIGQISSTAGSEGLATLRIDRLEEAKAAGTAVTAGNASLEINLPAQFIADAAGVEKRL